MATAAGIVSVVMGFAAALLLYEAIVPPARRDDSRRRERLRTFGFWAAIAAVAAAYIAAIW